MLKDLVLIQLIFGFNMWYPHYLYIVDSVSGIDEDTGEAYSSEDEVFYSSCKEQVNGSGKLINGADGATISYSSVIHLPLITEPIKVGAEVLVYSDENKSHLRIKGRVLRFSVDTMHCRLWV